MNDMPDKTIKRYLEKKRGEYRHIARKAKTRDMTVMMHLVADDFERAIRITPNQEKGSKE